MLPILEIYLAGGLFNVAERYRNILLALSLQAADQGRKIIIPQIEAEKFHNADGTFDLPAIRKDCVDHCSDRGTICVACLDGPDADSGTVCEFTVAMENTGRAISYRTDFRTDEKSEIGVNGMLRAEGSVFIYLPCLESGMQPLDNFILKLARTILEEIVKIEKAEGRGR